MNRAPLLLPAAFFVGGIVAGRESLAGAALAVCLVVALPFDSAARRLVFAGAFVAGIALASARPDAPQFTREIEGAVVDGTVTGDVTHRAWGDTAELTLTSGARLELDVAGRVAPGDEISVRGRIEPFDEPRNPGEPSARALAAERGVAGRLTGGRLLARRPASPWNPAAWLPRLRLRASEIVRSRVGEPEASILAGALWGERGDLPRDLRREFQETGTVHILVTAGLHLGVIAMLTSALLAFAGVPRAPAALVTLGTIWFYAALSGAHLPSLRAATMISVALAARACGARALSWNAYAAAAIVVAALWPASVEGASFALSFSCVGAILLFADHIGAWCERRNLPAFAAESLALTVATQIGVWPLTAATFSLVAPYAVVANLAVVPVVGSAMMLGLAQLATDRIPLVPDALAALDTGLLRWIEAVVHGVAALPGANLTLAPPPAWAVALYDLAALAAAAALRRERARLAAILLCCGSAAVLLPSSGARGSLTIVALDVGQGDALVVRTPSGHTLLVDAGGRIEIGGDGDDSPAELIGERIVVPYLIRAGVRRVEGIVLTHPHGDHVGGCAPVLRELGAAWIADGGQSYGGHAFRDCLATARLQHVPVREPRAGDVWRTDDGVTLRFLSPSEPYIADSGDDVNENSIVFMLEYGAFRALFMGDAGENAEARLLASGADLHADVLKVGHHGSAYASTPAFVAAVHPAIALVSVGRHNHFGHPAPRALATLSALGARIFRTDRCGAVTVTPGRSVTTMLPC